MRGVVGGNHDIRFGHPVLHQFGGVARQIDRSSGQVDRHQQLLAAERASECVDVLVVRIDQLPVAGGHQRILVANGDQPLVERVHGVWIVEFARRIDLGMIPVHRNPRLHGGVRRGEPRIGGTIPLHWRTRVVTAAGGDAGHHRFRGLHFGFLDPLTVGIEGFQIAVLVQPGEVDVGHAQLLALIDVGVPRCMCSIRPNALAERTRLPSVESSPQRETTRG